MSGARLPSRLLEWFWRADALRKARAEQPFPQPGQRQLVQRARLADEAAARLLEPAPPLEAGSSAGLALELGRQSIYWSLLALRQTSEPAPGSAGAWDSLQGRLSTLPEHIRSPLGETTASLEELERTLGEADFRAVAELPVDERTELAGRAKRLSRALVESVLEPTRRVESLWFQRVWRSGAVAAALGLLLVAFLGRSGPDLAAGRSWRTSSLGYPGCTSPAQDCGKEYFFHTQTEESPWLELDLGKSQTFAAVRVENRSDCCGDRAAPLVVEVSDDGKHFREIARRGEPFQVWSANVRSVSARFVRVRALRQTALHLRRVAVLK